MDNVEDRSFLFTEMILTLPNFPYLTMSLRSYITRFSDLITYFVKTRGIHKKA